MKLYNFIVAYDILNSKRAYKVRKLIYSYAFGGQKSVLEVLLSKRDVKDILKLLKPILEKEDRVNIIEVHSNAMLFGKAEILEYNNGVVII